MLPQSELKAYQDKINLPLFNDIVAFVQNTANATIAQRASLSRRCPFLTKQTSELQKKYGFLYLGELLERYEERFGMSILDLRAIALALGYTHDLTTEAMFVGQQRNNFLRKIRRCADGDIYLTGALYLLSEGQSGAAESGRKLVASQYDATEDLLFALSLYYDHGQTFMYFKEKLLHLLGAERTMPVLENTKTLDWLIAWLIPNVKNIKGKDMALFRALCALPVSHVKPGSRHYEVLLAHGYTPLEIAYANMMSVYSSAAPGVLSLNSIVTEKIAVSLFRTALSYEKALTPEVYELLSQVYRMYESFDIKCYGQQHLADTLREDVRIQNTETFIWFSDKTDIEHPVFTGFDIMSRDWDALAVSMEPKKYDLLFEACLKRDMSTDEIQSWLDRYQALTERNYVDIYWSSPNGNRFGLLVDKGILNLWSLFQNCLDESGDIVKANMLIHIWRYVREISTSQLSGTGTW